MKSSPLSPSCRRATHTPLLLYSVNDIFFNFQKLFSATQFPYAVRFFKGKLILLARSPVFESPSNEILWSQNLRKLVFQLIVRHHVPLLNGIFSIINYCSTMAFNFGWLTTCRTISFNDGSFLFEQNHPIPMLWKWLEQWNTFNCFKLVSCIWTLNTFWVLDTRNVLLPGPYLIIATWLPLNKMIVTYICGFR